MYVSQDWDQYTKIVGIMISGQDNFQIYLLFPQVLIIHNRFLI